MNNKAYWEVIHNLRKKNAAIESVRKHLKSVINTYPLELYIAVRFDTIDHVWYGYGYCHNNESLKSGFDRLWSDKTISVAVAIGFDDHQTDDYKTVWYDESHPQILEYKAMVLL